MDFILHKKDGAITNRAGAAKFFNGLKDGKYLVTAKGYKKRSDQQNKYWWGCLIPMVLEGLRNNGYNEVKTNEDAHEVIKSLFLKKKITSDRNGDEIEISGSTAKLRTQEFNDLMDEVIKWAAEYLSIQIPYPNESIPMFGDPMIAEHDNELNTIIIS